MKRPAELLHSRVSGQEGGDKHNEPSAQEFRIALGCKGPTAYLCHWSALSARMNYIGWDEFLKAATLPSVQSDA